MAARPAEPLEIRMLGEIRLQRAGKTLPLPASKKSRALLAYLCATGTSHRRERLCELLWDGPDDPRAALRWSLTKLRPLLDEAGATRLVADREHVLYEPRGARLDVAIVRGFLGRGLPATPTADLRSAAAAFTGPFLEGLDLPGCPSFHAWCVAERESLREQHVRVREELIARLAAEPDEALQHARALVALDPLAESSHLSVMRLLAAMGRIREALDEYERCRDVLKAELGTRPSPEMERVRMSLSAPAAPRSEPAIAPADPAAPPFVGRAAELELWNRKLAEGGPGLLLVAGDPGVGKTRLLEELKILALMGGGRVLSGRAFEAELVRPYGALIDALRDVTLPRGFPGQELAALLPHLGAQPAGGDRARLFEAVRRLLQALGDVTLVVVIDDLQWIDDASAALLHFLVRAAPPAIFVAAGRAGELGDNPAALRLLRGLEQERRLTRISLEPLGEPEIAALVRAVAPTVDAAAVFAACEGNPLFAVELAHAGGQVGATLDGLLRDRLERIEDPARRVLPWAAALGRTFDPGILVEVTGMPAGELVNALERFEKRGIVRSTGGGTYDFAHDLVRQAAYRRMSEPRRRVIHLQIAAALARQDDGSGAISGEVARHAALGGDDEQAAAACLRAAERCLLVFAHAEAAEVAARGMAHVQRLLPARRLPLQMRLLRTQAMNPLLRGRRGRELKAEITRTVLAARDAGLDGEAFLGLYLRSVVEFDQGDYAGAYVSSLEAMSESAASDPGLAVDQLGHVAKCLIILEKDVDRAASLVRHADEIAAGSARQVYGHLYAAGLLAAFEGDTDRAVTSMERALAALGQQWMRWEECDCLTRIVFTELEAGRHQEALRRCEQLGPLAARVDATERVAAEALEAVARLALGETTENLERSLSALRTLDAKGMMSAVLNLAAEVDLAAGRIESAATRAGEALAAATAVGRESQQVIAASILARVAMGRGDPAGARAHLEAVAPQLGRPLGASARAHRAVADVLARLSTPATAAG